MALVTGVIVTMAMLGGMVAQTPMATLTQWIGWRGAVTADSGLGVVIAILIAMYVQDRPPNSQARIEADKAHLQALGFWRALGAVLLNPQNWLGGLYTALMNLPVFLLGALWGMSYLVQVHHLTQDQSSWANTLLFIGIIFGSPAYGWLSDHLGRRVLPMVLGAIVSIVTMLVLMYAPGLSVTAVYVLFFLVGFLTSSQVLTYPLLAELNPPSLTSSAISIDSMMIMASGFVGQPFFGWVMKQTASGQVVNGVPVYSATDFMHAMWIMPIAFILGLGITWFFRESYCKAQA
jgi:MFS family permease